MISTKMKSKPRRLLTLSLAAGCGLFASAGLTWAGPAPARTEIQPIIPVVEEKPLCERFVKAFTLYSNKENPFIQEFALQGRLHLQYGYGDSDQGSYSSDDLSSGTWGPLEVRRWRLGAKMKFLHQFRLEGQINVTPNIDPFYNDLYDLYLWWEPRSEFNLGVGKFKVPFSQEYTTSSNRILTMERSMLVSQLVPSNLTGIMARGKLNKFSYTLGAYSGDQQVEFAEFDEGYAFLVKLGYDLSDQVAWKKWTVGFDYLNNSDAPQSGLKAYEHSFALYSDIGQGPYGFQAEALAASGAGNTSDVYGLNLIPSVYLIDKKLQLVLRYQLAVADAERGVRLQSRYERLAPDLDAGGRGKTYQAAYAGLNYYLCDHNLKLMTGLEYHNMDGGRTGDDFSGLTWTTGMRISF